MTLLTSEELNIISDLGSGLYLGNEGDLFFRTYNDYLVEAPLYLALEQGLTRFCISSPEGCYKCDLFDKKSRKFIEKQKARIIFDEAMFWRGISVHPSSSETFLGHFICIRCLLSLLISTDSVASMRASLKSNKNPVTHSPTSTVFVSAVSEFSI